MPKSPAALQSLPPIVAPALKKLGENLAIARVRRKQSQRAWALWRIGRAQALPEIAAPKHDQGALELDVRRATRCRAVRSAASIRARLARTRKL